MEFKWGENYICQHCGKDISKNEEFIPDEPHPFPIAPGCAFHKQCYANYKDKETIIDLVSDIPLNRKFDHVKWRIMKKVDRYYCTK